MPLPRLLVFDLDGTLIDSSLDLCNSVNAALAQVGKPHLSNELISSYIGDGAATLMRRALGDRGDSNAPPLDETLFERAYSGFLAYYREHKLDNTRCYAGVLEALRAIRAKHPALPMAVLTNKPVNPSREICAALGLAPFFFQNFGGNSFPTKKPEPEGLLQIIAEATLLTQRAIVAQEVVMIGDSDVDVLTARRAGARSMGCLYGLSPHRLVASNPGITVQTPADWLVALGL